jgi:hypothetical protein
LLKKVQAIKTGYIVEDRKPDLAFFNEKDELFAVLHFVKRKTVVAALNEFYKGKCICLQVKLEPGDDFSSLFEKLHQPDSVSTCFNPKCPTCGEHMQKIKLWIVDSECWKCNGEMKVAAVEAGMTRYSTYAGPDRFTENEIAMARSKGVIIAEHYSKTERNALRPSSSAAISVAALATPIPGNMQKSFAVRVNSREGSSFTDRMIFRQRSNTDNSELPVHNRIASSSAWVGA